MITLILVGGAAGLFVGAVLAGRYLRRLGIALPAAVTYLLGRGWEWDDEAMFFVLVVAAITVVGWAVGMRRSRVAHSGRMRGHA